MRMIVFFDLPVVSVEDKRNYMLFRKFLMRNGFIMLQESVYTKVVTNQSVEESVRKLIQKNKPPRGIIQLLTLTEKQFSKMEYIVGESKSEYINSDDKLVII